MTKMGRKLHPFRFNRIPGISSFKKFTLPGNKLNDDQVEIFLNQFCELDYILELSRINLELSLSKEAFFSKNSSVNNKEKISTIFLLNSIVHYNSGFDYLKALLYLGYSSIEELHKLFPKNRIEDKVEKMNIAEADWELALVKMINEQKWEEYKEWLNNNNKISKKLVDLFEKLEEKNQILRNEYQANQLKHGLVPHFSRTDRGNVIGCRGVIKLDQFFDLKKKRRVVSLGYRENTLNISDTQSFLIDYNNLTVKLLKYLQGELKVINKEK